MGGEGFSAGGKRAAFEKTRVTNQKSPISIFYPGRTVICVLSCRVNPSKQFGAGLRFAGRGSPPAWRTRKPFLFRTYGKWCLDSSLTPLESTYVSGQGRKVASVSPLQSALSPFQQLKCPEISTCAKVGGWGSLLLT